MEYFVMLDDAVDVIINESDPDSTNEKCSQCHWVAIQPHYMLTTPEIMTLENPKNMLENGFDSNLQLYTYINLTTLSATEAGNPTPTLPPYHILSSLSSAWKPYPSS